jgi:hypothetical protein
VEAPGIEDASRPANLRNLLERRGTNDVQRAPQNAERYDAAAADSAARQRLPVRPLPIEKYPGSLDARPGSEWTLLRRCPSCNTDPEPDTMRVVPRSAPCPHCKNGWQTKTILTTADLKAHVAALPDLP